MAISGHFLREVGFLYSAQYFHLTFIVSGMNYKKYEKFLLVSTVYSQRVLQLSCIDVIYLFQ